MTEQPRPAHVLAVDVGGTGIKLAVTDRTARTVSASRLPTGREAGPEAVVRTVLDAVAGHHRDAMRTGLRIAAVGLALPGIVDEHTGTAVRSTSIGWRDVPFRDLVTERTGLPCAVAHDVRAGGLAEAELGAGRGHRRFLFVPLGTGIAAAVMTDGHAEAGAHLAAGEIGHLRMRTGGRRCGCGGRGCAETYASAAAVADRYALATGRRADAAEVARRAAAGEKAARLVWDEAVDVLADTLLCATTLLDPELLVLGGGLARSGSQLFDPLRAALRDRALLGRAPRVEPAQLGDRAGCLGAALHALRLLADDSGHHSADAGPPGSRAPRERVA
ncbi:ROK family protein [Streptomyces sp. NPDC047097]|uniref:ROK family protein n=1 Tax=Streptomyces sp. NPDC047097 TaxID=3155260 RepID=UPI0033DB6BD8